MAVVAKVVMVVVRDPIMGGWVIEAIVVVR